MLVEPGVSRAICSGGQNWLRPPTILGTPMRSSGASCVPSNDTQSSPNDAANCRTSDDRTCFVRHGLAVGGLG